MRTILLSLLLLLPISSWAQDRSAPAAAPASPATASAQAAAPASAKGSAPADKAVEKPAVVPTVPATKPDSPDARFDKTGDGLVDAADWALMTDKEKRDYARASLQALGEDPDAPVGNGETRLDRYLAGLRAVYE